MKIKIQDLNNRSTVKGIRKYISRTSKYILILCFLFVSELSYSQIGTWTKVATNAPHENMGSMLLMTDGTILIHNSVGGTDGDGTGWDKLTPNAQGSYVNGTWSTVASMHHDRLFFASQVLPSGKVFVSGGEYGSGDTAAELYDPVANTWTVIGGMPINSSTNKPYNVYDGNSEILPNGNILIGAQVGPDPSYDCVYYTASTNRLSVAPKAPLNHDEAEWLKLPDSSILFVGIATTKSCRYRPQTNTWISDGTLPVDIWDTYGEESGCGAMLPNGKAVFFGATEYNAIYTPTGTTAAGTWTAAADFPTIDGDKIGQTDAPGAMMVNGHILLSVSPEGTSSNNEFLSPIWFIEYDYTTNTFTKVTSILPGLNADSIAGSSGTYATMLDLPDGTVLFAHNQDGSSSEEYWIYTPGSGPIPQGKPTINSILPDGCPLYKITGKLFNGISEGTEYGDDWQMASNYPLVRCTNAAGNVYYCKTTDWNRIGAVQTDSLEDTAVFTTANLPAGTYSLVVVVNGFASNPTIFTTLQASMGSHANILCNGTNSGTATVSVTGGIAPYTYTWTASGGSGVTATGLSAGTYTVTVHDANDCVETATVVITQPSTKVSASASVTSEASCGSTGSASSTVSGGTSPYTYSWTGGGTNATASGLSAGTYTLSVTDNNGCDASASIVITQSSSFSISANATGNVKCNGSNNGSATATVSGGASPYTYSWTGGQTNATATGLSAGSYTVTITDHSGCSGNTTVIITQPTVLTASGSVTSNASCAGNTGSASSTVSGGTSPYTYSWTGGGTNSTVSGLSAGTYTLSVTDNNGCAYSATVTITQSSSLGTVSASTTTNVTCNGSNNGSATASTTAGTAPYTYSWSGGAGTNAVANGLSAGTYTVTVTDKNGCSGTASAIVTQPALLAASGNVTSEANCGGNTGSASSTVSGGTSPYTYSWTGGGTNSTINGLSAGTYIVNVTDNNGCSKSASVTITQSSSLGLSASVTSNIACNGLSDGGVTVTISGGASPYTYAWTGGNTNSGISGLSAGVYTVQVTDKNGCQGTASVAVTQPTLLSVSGSVTSNVTCIGNNGSASSTVTGGTLPYTYSWTGGGSNSTVSGLSAGTYVVDVTDNNGCSASSSVTITQTAGISSISAITSNVKCNGENNGSATATVSGGTTPYTYSWQGGGTSATDNGLSAGTYTLSVTDKNGCSGTTTAVITQPKVLTSTTYTAAATNSKDCDGEAAVTASGGTTPYTYSWSGGAGTTDTIKGQCAGNYCCTITDNNGCTESTCVTIPVSTTGVADINNTSNINIYPQPNTGSFTIAGVVRGQIIELYNILGQQISSVTADQANVYFNIANQADGIYLVRILNKDGSLVAQKKIIKSE